MSSGSSVKECGAQMALDDRAGHVGMGIHRNQTCQALVREDFDQACQPTRADAPTRCGSAGQAGTGWPSGHWKCRLMTSMSRIRIGSEAESRRSNRVPAASLLTLPEAISHRDRHLSSRNQSALAGMLRPGSRPYRMVTRSTVRTMLW